MRLSSVQFSPFKDWSYTTVSISLCVYVSEREREREGFESVNNGGKITVEKHDKRKRHKALQDEAPNPISNLQLACLAHLLTCIATVPQIPVLLYKTLTSHCSTPKPKYTPTTYSFRSSSKLLDRRWLLPPPLYSSASASSSSPWSPPVTARHLRWSPSLRPDPNRLPNPACLPVPSTRSSWAPAPTCSAASSTSRSAPRPRNPAAASSRASPTWKPPCASAPPSRPTSWASASTSTSISPSSSTTAARRSPMATCALELQPWSRVLLRCDSHVLACIHFDYLVGGGLMLKPLSPVIIRTICGWRIRCYHFSSTCTYSIYL